MINKSFRQLSKSDAAIAGGKGASLGEMTSAGIPVPPGYVILSEAFEKFLEETDLNVEIDATLETVDTQKMHTVEHASEKIQALILEAKMPEDIEKIIEQEFQKLDAKFVAVRSSATAKDGAEAAWAGQLNSYLNTTEDSILKNVQKCWASLFTPRAIFYRFEKGLHNTHISVAVVVQKMIQSEKSGIAFSVHPVTQDYNQLIIEAGFGLGEAIVSGSITPDAYVVEKEPRKILDINVATQAKGLFGKVDGGNEWRDIPESQASSQVLDEKDILELSELIMQIENHYGFPCDIEWAQEEGKFYITQSRPITTLKSVGFGDKNKSIVTEISSLNLSKNWDAKLSIFVIDFGVSGYFEPLKNAFGYTFNGFFVDHKEGMSAGYLIDEDMDNLAKFYLDKVSRDEKTIEIWCDKLKKDTDLVNIYYKKGPEWYLDYEHMKEFYDTLMEFSVYQIVLKELPNRLDNKMLENYGKALEDARKYGEHIFHEIDDVLNKPLGLIIKKTGYSYEEISSITYDEYLGYLKNDTLPDKEILKMRRKHCAMYYSPKLNIIDAETADDILAKLTEKTYDGQNITGNIGYGGKVRGRCRIVDNVTKFNQFEEGEVLVAGMTNPNYLPIMKIAGAIVTDAGGVLSHAAIVARELKIPCIIGTKIATQVLQDGDLVEVDADKGIVRILERIGDDNIDGKNKDEINYGKEEYVKIFNRSLFLMGCQNYDLGERVEMEKITPVGYFMDPVLHNLSGKGTNVYYNFTDPRQDPKLIAEYFNDNREELLKLKEEYCANCDLLRALIVDLKHDDYQKLFNLIIKIWPLIAISNMLGDNRDNITGVDTNLIELYREMRKYSDGLIQNSHLRIAEILKKVVPEKYKKYHKYLKYEEVVNGNYPAIEELQERQKGFIFHKGKLFTGMTLDEYAQKNNYEFVGFKASDNVSENSISGQVAYEGKAKGYVRIIFEVGDIDRVKKGDILVTSMTTPDFLPAMNLASAFVTDEGGITCHASIVAREIQKPCIIGTKIATQVLHDGDLVEVDADSGVVRILKKQ